MNSRQHQLCFSLLLIFTLCCFLFSCSLSEDNFPFRIHYGDRNSKKIAITVDDCGSITSVRKIYELCSQYHIGVTFFPTGKNIKPEDAELWRSLASDPMVLIGSHTQNHHNWHGCTKEQIQSSILDFQDTLDSVLGYHYPVRYVRPPFGHCTATKNGGTESTVQAILAEIGFDHAILWDVSNTNPKGAYQMTKNGSILLFHAYEKDYRCLKELIPQLLNWGFEPVTIDCLLQQNAH